MAQNKNALIRYRTIDKCLQNPFRKWTLGDLIDECSNALYEYEGREIEVSRRTVQLDIQTMRSDKLGYNAPIVVYDKKYYKYEDPDFSITDIPLNESDMQVLSESVEMLKQFKDFSLFSELGGIIQRLEDRIYTEKNQQPSIIHFDKNEQLIGLEHLDVLYQAILKKVVLHVRYKSFTSAQSKVFTVHPLLLKEYNNRWFLICRTEESSSILNLALDRIKSFEPDPQADYIDEPFDGDIFYKHTIGVTVRGLKDVMKVRLHFDPLNAPYVRTKPLHHTQKILKSLEDGSIIVELQVHQNFELERLILGFGESVQVIKPPSLRRRILDRLTWAINGYQTQLSNASLVAATRILQKNGTSSIEHLFGIAEIRTIGRAINRYFETSSEPRFGKRKLLIDIPELIPHLLNSNLRALVKTIDDKAFLTKAIYFDKPSNDNWYVTWHQDIPINVTHRDHVDGFTGWTQKSGVISVRPPEYILHNTFTLRIHLDHTTEENGALKVICGSQNRILNDEEKNLIVQRATPLVIKLQAGGVHLMKPLCLHSSSKTINQKRRRVIHLEFSSTELPGGMDWMERIDFQD
ncbi:MAG: WYL domain-containing protein [Flavobacteriales bacterium]|nr:WYL domain-containing protein [Flavobacteriales bacterium]